jgi:hypothetical protein
MAIKLRNYDDVYRSLLASEWKLLNSFMGCDKPSPFRTAVATGELLLNLTPDAREKPVVRIAVVAASMWAENMGNGVFWQVLPDLLGLKGKLEVVLIGLDAPVPTDPMMRFLSDHLAVAMPAKRTVKVTWFGGGLAKAIELMADDFDLCVWAAPGLCVSEWKGLPLQPFPSAKTAVLSMSFGDAMDDLMSCFHENSEEPRIQTAKLVPYLGEGHGAPGSYWFVPPPGAVAHVTQIKDFEVLSSIVGLKDLTEEQFIISGSAGLIGQAISGELFECGIVGLVLSPATGKIGLLDEQGRFTGIGTFRSPAAISGNSQADVLERRRNWIGDAIMLDGLISMHRKSAQVSAKVLVDRFRL